MKKILLTMFLVVGFAFAAFASSNEQKNPAIRGPGDQASVLVNDHAAIAKVPALALAEASILPTRTDTQTTSAVRRIIAPASLERSDARDIVSGLRLSLRVRHKPPAYKGFGHNHYARADV